MYSFPPALQRRTSVRLLEGKVHHAQKEISNPQLSIISPIEDGHRESEESWACLLRDLKKRGMRAPELAVGDGALGFWSALRDVFPETRAQRDWVHKSRNVLDSLPKSVHRRAKAAICEITSAEDKSTPRRRSKPSPGSSG